MTKCVHALAQLVLLAGSVTAAPALNLCGDVNASDSLSAGDALQVLRRSVGLDVEMACYPPGQSLRTGSNVNFGPGSDGDVVSGAPRAFVDNGDGTITDYATGLMWEKKDRLGGIHDLETTYTWSTGTNQLNGTVATVFLANLNAAGGFAGYKDWRLPSRFELETLLHLGRSSLAAHVAFDTDCDSGCSVDDCSCTSREDYWSSSSVAGELDSAWGVNGQYGHVSVFEKVSELAARAVRVAVRPAASSTCRPPEPPQCSMGSLCTIGFCSYTRQFCFDQSECPLSGQEQCCCSGNCL